ncbi:acyl-CoA dehydrogenase [Rhodococcus opacus]|nr:acyl-CoA dehydrogenase [Rhodococcus opacus]
MDFTPNAEERDVQSTVRAFVETHLKPHEPMLLRREAEGGAAQLTREELREVQLKGKASGLWGVDLPEEYGGVDFDAVLQVLCAIELGHTFVEFKFGGSPVPITDLSLLNDTQRAEYVERVIEGGARVSLAMTEPHSGSDARTIRTRAVRDGSDWIITGEKSWISYAPTADLALVVAKTEGGDADAVTTFLVPRERGWTSTKLPTMGTWPVGSISFDGVRVPDTDRVGEVGQGFGIAMAQLNKGRLVMGTAVNIGASERLLEMMVDFANERVTFGQPLAHRQLIQRYLVDSELELRSAKMLTLHAAAKMVAGEDVRHEVAVAKVAAARASNKIVDHAMQVHGATGSRWNCRCSAGTETYGWSGSGRGPTR